MATTGWDGCNTFSHPTNFGALLSGTASGTQGASGKLVVPEVCRLSSSSSLGRATPQKTSSLVKERYHLTSSLSSKTLLANKWGSPLAGRLFCSAQCWRALVYATTFSLGISQMSLHAKIESAGGINLFLWRHGGAGGAWRVASLKSNSCNHRGSPKDALTSLASFLASSFPSTANSSPHQSGVSHLSAFHGTHSSKSRILGSRGIFLPSSSEVSRQPLQEGSYHCFQLQQFLQVRASALRPLFTLWHLGVGGLAWGRFVCKSDLVASPLPPFPTWSMAVPTLRPSP